jgi:L,D-transpeptidase YcbB
MRPRTAPRRHSLAVALSIWAVAVAPVVLPVETMAAPGATEFREALESAGPLESGGLKLDRDTLTLAYRARDFEPVWAEKPELTEAFETALGAAGREGLDPEAFDLSALEAAVSGDALTPVGRELLLSGRFLAYAQALAQGRVSPSAITEDWLLARPEFDPAVVLGTLAQSGDAGATLASLLPSAPDYGRLRQGLERYRVLAAAGGWQRIETNEKIEPGQKGDIVKALRARLVAEGDLAAGCGRKRSH